MLSLFVAIQQQMVDVTADSLASGAAVQAVTTSATAPVMEELSLWQLCLEGGIIMIPLLLLLIVSIYVFTERALVIRRAAHEDSTFMQRIKDYIHDGDIDASLSLCGHTCSPGAI